jgi:eukaryotic-like serine/threonine-protein kinase
MHKQIGKYQLRQLLGEGASGSVFLALDTFSGADVALKVLSESVMANPEDSGGPRDQFINEASLAGQLHHPHIVAILEAVMAEDSGYLAMEHVPGGTLAQFTGPDNLLPMEDIIEIGFKSCGALDYAFRQGIVHRDIKPANIMVVEGTNIKVADFGAALLKQAQATEGELVGTPAYMSPEQIAGARLTQHSDMFAMGVVLYELLAGKRPFIADTLMRTFRKITEEDPVAPSTLRPGMSSKLDPIVLRMLSKSPEDRYPTWADLALDIAEVGKLSVYLRTIPDSEKFRVLRTSTVFKNTNDAQIWELVHASHWTMVPPGNAIIREGASGHSLFLLARGEAKVTKSGRLLDVIKAGECFGEMAYIQGGEVPRHATVESMTEVLTVEFDTTALAAMSESCQLEFARGLLSTVVGRLSLADARLARSA